MHKITISKELLQSATCNVFEREIDYKYHKYNNLEGRVFYLDKNSIEGDEIKGDGQKLTYYALKKDASVRYEKDITIIFKLASLLDIPEEEWFNQTIRERMLSHLGKVFPWIQGQTYTKPYFPQWFTVGKTEVVVGSHVSNPTIKITSFKSVFYRREIQERVW
jgi:hypothetical protein